MHQDVFTFGRESVDRRVLVRPRVVELSGRFEGRADIFEASRTPDEDQVEARVRQSLRIGVQSRGKTEVDVSLEQYSV